MAVGRRSDEMMELPTYADGCFQLYEIETDESEDFPKEVLVNRNMNVWFREISVFDRVRNELGQSGIEVTMKIRIPKYKGINSKCICIIEGEKHQVYNAAHVIDKNGFKETELTLKKPESEVMRYEER